MGFLERQRASLQAARQHEDAKSQYENRLRLLRTKLREAVDKVLESVQRNASLSGWNLEFHISSSQGELAEISIPEAGIRLQFCTFETLHWEEAPDTWGWDTHPRANFMCRVLLGFTENFTTAIPITIFFSPPSAYGISEGQSWGDVRLLWAGTGDNSKIERATLSLLRGKVPRSDYKREF